MRRLRQTENKASGQTRIAFHQSMRGSIKPIDIGAWWGTRGRGKYTVFLEHTPSRYLTDEGKLEKICNSLTPMYETEGGRFDMRKRAATSTASYYAGDVNNFKVCFPRVLRRNACEIRRGRFKCNILLVDAAHEASPALRRRVEHCYKNAFDRIAIPDASDGASLRYPDFQKGTDLQYCMRDDGFVRILFYTSVANGMSLRLCWKCTIWRCEKRIMGDGPSIIPTRRILSAQPPFFM
jgi:hypothetical protein